MTPGGGGADLAGVSAPKDVSLNIKTSEMMKLKSEKLIQAALIHQKTTFMEFCEKENLNSSNQVGMIKSSTLALFLLDSGRWSDDSRTLLLLLLQLVFDFLRLVVLNQSQNLFVVHHALDEFPL